jgi:acyl-CoA synthetase (AMP-forming)/AMP-acid ligase II
MELPLTPVDFLRRARKLHGTREAVVDGDLRLTYEEFGARCDKWSSALQKLGVRHGERVGTIASNTHQHLEQYYAVPQIGATLVPLNFRLTPEDFVYLVNHSGCKVLCVHEDFLDAVDSVRSRLPHVRHFVALEGRKAGWLEYETLLAGNARRA